MGIFQIRKVIQIGEVMTIQNKRAARAEIKTISLNMAFENRKNLCKVNEKRRSLS